MAAAFLNALADPATARAISAGTQPAERVDPVMVEAMREAGFDLSHEQPRLLTAEIARGADWLITMGCGDDCPVVPNLKRDDWALDDPAGQPIARVRVIRDEIRGRVARLIDVIRAAP